MIASRITAKLQSQRLWFHAFGQLLQTQKGLPSSCSDCFDPADAVEFLQETLSSTYRVDDHRYCALVRYALVRHIGGGVDSALRELGQSNFEALLDLLEHLLVVWAADERD